jgi:hypothetical protein
MERILANRMPRTDVMMGENSRDGGRRVESRAGRLKLSRRSRSGADLGGILPMVRAEATILLALR